MKKLIATLALTSAALIGFGGCADDGFGRDGVERSITETEWQTVTDQQTGQTFRCLYLHDGYTSEFICYDPDTGVTVGG